MVAAGSSVLRMTEGKREMRRQSARRVRRGGFTLLEVLLVLAILGVIAAIVVPRLLGQQREANVDAAKASIQGFDKALELYALRHNGQYPTGTNKDVFALLMSNVDEDGTTQEVLLDEIPLDPWGQELQYSLESPHNLDGRPDVWSLGPDGADGTADDITNWPVEEV
jgi:general secretion pathway protein G